MINPFFTTVIAVDIRWTALLYVNAVKLSRSTCPSLICDRTDWMVYQIPIQGLRHVDREFLTRCVTQNFSADMVDG